MAMEKSLYAAPMGLSGLGELGVDVEIELAAPSIVSLDDGSIEITFGKEQDDTLESAPFDANLAEYLDEGTLTELATDIMGEVESDIQGRKEWADTFVKGLESIGFRYEMRTDPWEEVCTLLFWQKPLFGSKRSL